MYEKLTQDQERERLRLQSEIILSNIPGSAIYPPDDLDGMQYLHMDGHILVRDADLDRVRALVPGEVEDALINGVTVYKVASGDTHEALDTIDASLGRGVATPNHVFYVTPVSTCCPATEPDPSTAPEPYPALVDASTGLGNGVAVSVVDTGLISSLTTRHAWLHDVTGDEEQYDPANIGPYVGHGTFVAGVVRGVAPGTSIQVDGFLADGGAVLESKILMALYHAVEQSPDIITMSAGCSTRHNLPPLGFEVLWENRLRHLKGTVLVVAAGNNSSRQPFWPAAFEWAVSVGALDGDGNRASYSDFGSWVDVYALGSDIVNAYPDGTYTYTEPPRVGETAEFTSGLAEWSGTSFATPMFAGLIAARMSQTGQSGRDAADSILRIARQDARPGIGAIADAKRALDPDPRGY